MKFDTRLVKAGQDAADGTGDIVPPIHIATTFEQRSQSDLRYFYGRGENPTREALETCLASLENAEHALTFSSGQAAGASALSLLRPGQRLISSDDVYGGTYSLFSTLDRYGITVEYRDFSDPEQIPGAIADDVGMIWLETPTNPLLKVSDIKAVTAAARPAGIPVLVDNTFASPALQQPLELGADISLYSTTKFVSGHSDVIGGALVFNDDELRRDLFSYRTAYGNIPGALDCYLLHRGVKTLSLRVERQTATAQAIAERLTEHERVGAVHYPGLPSHPQYALAGRQMTGPGSVISFEYLGDPGQLLKQIELFGVAVSLGSVHSLIECPALMTHRPIPAETRRALGISDNLMRLSIGIEDPEDLTADLWQAL